MSAFLGPIHHWLYSKIRLVESRENKVAAAFTEKYGDDATEAISQNIAKYGEHFPDTPLEEMIGEIPIHGYLQGAIDKVETREAGLIAALIEKHGDEAEALLLETVYNHGSEIAKAEAAEIDASSATADDIYRAMKNIFLDGMPCDHVVEVNNISDKELVEMHSDCLHRRYWQDAGASEAFMCKYLGRWVDGFVEGLGGGISHERTKTLIAGDANCEDVYRVG